MKLKIKKGLDLSLAGAIADTTAPTDVRVHECAIVPDDFPGFTPKLDVKEGDIVAIGSPLMHDKDNEEVKLVSPAAGIVKSVVRGARRKIERVVISVDQEAYAAFEVSAIDTAGQALSLLARSGMLCRMRQRPYDIVPRPDRQPRDIFVTAIDSSPLSPGLAFLAKGKKALMEKAVALLRKLTPGKVYLSVGADWTEGDIAGAEMVEVTGPHPSGNISVQIANIAPVNKGETVWGLDVVTLCKIGSLLADGKVSPLTTVALTGAEVKTPGLINTIEGAQIAPLIDARLAGSGHHARIISGNVLTGTAVAADGFLRYPYRQITVIAEGDDVDEFMGWASLSPKKMSVSRSFPGHFFGKLFAPDARLKGGRRAMIMSGEYDKVMPIDILPEYLLKAIIAKDIDAMEKLGIYEVAPEDFALAEYVDTSKQPIQQMVREGLDYLRKELE